MVSWRMKVFFLRKNVVDIIFGVFDKGLDKLVGLLCGVCRFFKIVINKCEINR